MLGGGGGWELNSNIMEAFRNHLRCFIEVRKLTGLEFTKSHYYGGARSRMKPEFGIWHMTEQELMALDFEQNSLHIGNALWKTYYIALSVSLTILVVT